MKKTLLSASFLLIMSLAVHADVIQKLTINGEEVAQTVASITFDNDNVVLHFSDATSQTADMESVVLSIQVADNTAIYSLKGYVSDQLCIAGLQPETKIAIYDAAGHLVLSATAAQAECILSTSRLPQGVYILSAGHQVVKFIKR